MRKLSAGLVVALLGGAFLGGCGSSSKSKSSTISSATGGRGSAATQLTPPQRVEACKRAVQAPSTLSASTKARLLRTCERVGTSAAAQRELVREACVALASREPAGPVRERALGICHRVP
jgi:outer membrane murein-binding lipoprotein Lpp